MVTIGLRRGADGGVLVRVGTGERVTAGQRPLSKLVRRYERVRLRIEDPGLLVEPDIQELLTAGAGVLSEVVVGTVAFDLACAFDATALRWVVNGCRAGVFE